MSTQNDFVPEEYMEWMIETQDNVPSEFSNSSDTRKYVSDVLREELSVDFDQVFESWDDIPLGIASIGEVHKATLKSSGEIVAVKVQLPNMEAKFRSDIRLDCFFLHLCYHCLM
jgi:predicted unusual protein kinase regulating ubiquinone biosynthesis (AarF/ABC1/UbiB family)